MSLQFLGLMYNYIGSMVIPSYTGWHLLIVGAALILFCKKRFPEENIEHKSD